MTFEPHKNRLPASSPERELQIQELTSVDDWRSAAEVLKVLRPSLDINKFLSAQDRLAADGYRLVGVRAEEKIVSVASFTISPHAMLGRELLIHDMATLANAQKRGYASQILGQLQHIAHSEGCGRIFVHTKEAQGLYSKSGFQEYSTGMIKKI